MFDRISACLLLASLSIVHVQSTVHIVTVGNGGFVYRPPVVNASKGDTVMFQFYPTNHSVYRAVYTDSPTCPGGYCNPCVPANLYPGNEDNFFFSGLMLGDLNNPPSWNLTINDTKPIFFSCSAPGSCHPNGMVGVINPNASTSISTQTQAAKQAQYQLAPGDQFPAEGEPAAPSSSGSGSSPTNTAAPSGGNSGGKSGLSGGAIAGIVVGCVVGVAILGAAIFYWAKSRTYGQIFSAGKEPGGSSAPGGSDAGGVGAWVAGQQQQQQQQAEKTVPADMEAQRQSYQTVPGSPAAAPSPIPPGAPSPRAEDGAQFVGYNRQSAQPEYAFEAPGIDNQINELRTSKSRENIPEEPPSEKPESPSGRVELP